MKQLTRWTLALVMLVGLTFTACEQGEITHGGDDQFKIENLTFIRVLGANDEVGDGDQFIKFNIDGSVSSWWANHNGDKEELYDSMDPVYTYSIETQTAYVTFPKWDEDENGNPLSAIDTIVFTVNDNGTVTLHETLDLWGAQNMISTWMIYNGTCPNTHAEAEATGICGTWQTFTTEYDPEMGGAYVYASYYTIYPDGSFITGTEVTTPYEEETEGEIEKEIMKGTYVYNEENNTITFNYEDSESSDLYGVTFYGNNILGLTYTSDNGVYTQFNFRSLEDAQSTIVGTWVESPEMTEDKEYTVYKFNTNKTFETYTAAITEEGLIPVGDATTGYYEYYVENKGLQLYYGVNSLAEVTETTESTYFALGAMIPDAIVLAQANAISVTDNATTEAEYVAKAFARIAK